MVFSIQALTPEQMAESAAMMRQACQPKTKATDADIDAIRVDKVFADNKPTKCFVNCILEMMQVMKKGKLQQETAIRSIRSLMPEDLVEDQVNAINACVKAAVGIKDNCEASYAMLKCQAENAQNFIFV